MDVAPSFIDAIRVQQGRKLKVMHKVRVEPMSPGSKPTALPTKP